MNTYAKSKEGSDLTRRWLSDWLRKNLVPRNIPWHVLQIFGGALFHELYYWTTPTGQMVVITTEGAEVTLRTNNNGTETVDINLWSGDSHEAKQLAKHRPKLHEQLRETLGMDTSPEGFEKAIANQGGKWSNASWTDILLRSREEATYPGL